MTRFVTLLLSLAFCQAFAQDIGNLAPIQRPPLANPVDPTKPAKLLFGHAQGAAKMEARVFGSYAKGCLAGGEALNVNGKAWQVMRLSRNRNWAHPDMIDFLEDFAGKVPQVSKWPGILVGDMSQSRGGPMLTGHASHQIGLDADIWLTPMPKQILSREEREMMSATMMVREDRKDIDERVWSQDHLKVIKLAAQDPRVERILVNAAIKKALCREAGSDRKWLQKVRPFWGHDYHMHIRIGCPKGNATCISQDAVVAGEACDLDYWFTDSILYPKPSKTPVKPKPPMSLDALPQECRQVLLAK
jgi:penicillin-insensitive murein DD-endopeptidase